MYKVYQYQMVLMHAIFIIVGGWAYYTWFKEIREELRWMMNILLLINILEIGNILYRLIVWCPDDLLNSNEFGRCKFKNRIKYVTDYTTIFIIVKYVEIPPEYNYNDDIPIRSKGVIGRV
ncbi:16123_t:CDS:2 [Funneliformis caledonium]|uniref:16123_t:CDS:1 n=1 Tax=Funneliformis caledonium TaxID=1117310 RepID=A0A9N8WHZ3_9GLOM|nr:16123_t:CDS:2 [Funneliformis caledonium]